MKVCVMPLNGEEFTMDFGDEATVIEAKEKIKSQQGYPQPAVGLQLIFGSKVLDNASTLSEASVKDGDTLTLLKRAAWAMMELLVNISDDTQWHGKHKFALRSKPLLGEVEKIDVTVRDFQDQGWGGCQARLFIYLHGPEGVVASKLIFGPLRTDAYDQAKHGRSPSCTLGEEEPVVALARQDMFYILRYQCGGGGGHEITVKDWCCKITPAVHDNKAASIKVSSTVDLHQTSRLGPDRTTGLWELSQPFHLETIRGVFKDEDENYYNLAQEGGKCVLSSSKNNMTGVLAPNDEILEGDISTDEGQLKARLNAKSWREIVFEWKKDDETTWSKKTLCQHVEGLINPDEQLRSYSSVYSDNAVGTGHARSMLDSPQAWSAKESVTGQWMQLDLGEEKSIRGVVIQGREDYDQAVRSCKVSCSIDGTSFEELEQTFNYTAFHFSEKQEVLFEGGAVKARYIKFAVDKWFSHISMRAGVLEAKQE